jgi:tight adherence protein B
VTGIAAASSGLLLVAGMFWLLRGLRRTEPVVRRRRAESLGDIWARATRRPVGPRGRRRDVVLAASLVAGFLITAVTGWVIALVLLPVLTLGLPYLLSAPKPRDVELLEAMDRWVRSLAATLATGRSITDAIRISLRTAPPLLVDELAVLVLRLNNRWETRDALVNFADALDSPDVDGVVAALMLATSRGTNGASVTLQALADSIQAQLKARRVIEVERSKPYVVVRQVTVISLLTLVGVFVLSPTFFEPYRTPLGQILLSALLVLYFGSLLLMRRKAAQRGRPRVLVARPR